MAKQKKKPKGFFRRLAFWRESSSEEEESTEEDVAKKEEKRGSEPRMEEEESVKKYHEKCLIPVCRDPKIAEEEVKYWPSLRQVEYARPSTIIYHTDILERPILEVSKQGSEKKARPIKVAVYKIKGNKAVEIKMPKVRLKAPRERKESSPEMPKIRTRDTQEVPPDFNKAKFMKNDDSSRTGVPVRKALVSEKAIKREEIAESEKGEQIAEMETASLEARSISSEKSSKIPAKIGREQEQKELDKLECVELEMQGKVQRPLRGEHRWKEITKTKVFGRKGKKYWKKVTETKVLGKKGVRYLKKVIDSKVIGKYNDVIEISPMIPEERKPSHAPEISDQTLEYIVTEEEPEETAHPESPVPEPRIEIPSEESMIAEETYLGQQKELQKIPTKKRIGITRPDKGKIEVRKPQMRQKEESTEMYETTIKRDKGIGISKKHPIIIERRRPITKAKTARIRETPKHSKKDQFAKTQRPLSIQQKKIVGPKSISERKKAIGHPEKRKEQRTQKQIPTVSKRKQMVVKDEVFEEASVIPPEEKLFPGSIDKEIELRDFWKEASAKPDTSTKLEIDKDHVESKIEITEIPRQSEEQVKAFEEEQVRVEENLLMTEDEALKDVYDEKVALEAAGAEKWRKITKAKVLGKKGVKKWKKVIQSEVLGKYKGEDVSENRKNEMAVKPTVQPSVDEDVEFYLVLDDVDIDKKTLMQRETLETDSEMHEDLHAKSITLDSSGSKRWKRITETKVLGYKGVKKWKLTVQSRVLASLKKSEEIPLELHKEAVIEEQQKIFGDKELSETSDTVKLADIKKASVPQVENLDQSGVTPEECLIVKAPYESFGVLKEEALEDAKGQVEPKLSLIPVEELSDELELCTIPQSLSPFIQEGKISKENLDDVALETESGIKEKGKLSDDFGSFIKSQSIVTIPEEEISEDLQKEIITEAIERGIISHPDYPEPFGKESYEDLKKEFIPETPLRTTEEEILKDIDSDVIREEESIIADRERKTGNAESKVVLDAETAEPMDIADEKELIEGVKADETSEETSEYIVKEVSYPEFQVVDNYSSLEKTPETDILIMTEETPIDSKSELTVKSDNIASQREETRDSVEIEILLDSTWKLLPQEMEEIREEKIIELEESDDYRKAILDSEIQDFSDYEQLEEIPEIATSTVPEKEVIPKYEDVLIKETETPEEVKRKSSTPRDKEYSLSDEEMIYHFEKKPVKKNETSIVPEKEVAQDFPKATFKEGGTDQTEEQTAKHLDEDISSEQEMYSPPKTGTQRNAESILSSDISSFPAIELSDIRKFKSATDESIRTSEDVLGKAIEEEIAPELKPHRVEYEMKIDSLEKLHSEKDRNGKRHDSIIEEIIISEEDIPEDIEVENVLQPEAPFSPEKENGTDLKEEITQETESVAILNGRKSGDKNVPTAMTEKIGEVDVILGHKTESEEDSLKFDKKGYWRKIKIAVRVGQSQKLPAIIIKINREEQTKKLNMQSDNGAEIPEFKWEDAKAKNTKNGKYIKEEDIFPSASVEQGTDIERENMGKDKTAAILHIEQGIGQSYSDRMESISMENHMKLWRKIANSTRFLDRVRKLRQQRKVTPAAIKSGEMATVSMELSSGKFENPRRKLPVIKHDEESSEIPQTEPLDLGKIRRKMFWRKVAHSISLLSFSRINREKIRMVPAPPTHSDEVELISKEQQSVENMEISTKGSTHVKQSEDSIDIEVIPSKTSSHYSLKSARQDSSILMEENEQYSYLDEENVGIRDSVIRQGKRHSSATCQEGINKAEIISIQNESNSDENIKASNQCLKALARSSSSELGNVESQAEISNALISEDTLGSADDRTRVAILDEIDKYENEDKKI